MPPLKKISLLFGTLIILLAGFYFHTRENDFPFFYIPVEVSKVDQVIREKLNFRHPALMINMTRTISGIQTGFHLKEAFQTIVVTGRTLNAAYAAMAILTLMLLTYYYSGPWAALVFGAVAILSHTLLDETHIMKEEPAFLMGISLVLFAGYWFERLKNQKSLIALAIASGIALSCKWPAVIGVGLSLAMVCILSPQLKRPFYTMKGRALTPLGLWGMITLAVFLGLNYQIFFRFRHVPQGMGHEVHHVLYGYDGLVEQFPLMTYWTYFTQNIPLLFQALFGIYLLHFFWNIKKHSLHEWMEALFCLFYLMTLALSKYTSERYFLTLEILILYLGSKALFGLLKNRIHQNGHIVIALGLVVLTWYSGWPAFKEHLEGFSRDSRKALLSYINRQLPKTAVLMADSRLGIPIDSNRFQKIAMKKGWVVRPAVKMIADREKSYVSDYGTLQNLKQYGVTYIAILSSVYERLSDPRIHFTEADRSRLLHQKQFYQELKAQGKLLWQWTPRPGDHPTHLEVPIRLYAI